MRFLVSISCIAVLLFSGFSGRDCSQSVLFTVSGDLDKDKIAEKVVVRELNEKGENGNIRLLEIFKKTKSGWKLWHASKTAVLQSEAGGMMGDPFTDNAISIVNGVLVLEHDGGSSWKWNTTHRYRFQNNQFELIGYSTSYGKLCEYWAEFDYNLSTGKIKYKKEFEDCDEQSGDQIAGKVEAEEFSRKLKNLPTLENINTVERKVTTPKYKEEIYF